MSSRLKLPPKKKGKQTQKNAPDSADDFQEAAEAEEETGGKWRAGDKAKSCRAFLRAIEIYDRGLGRHPRDFDLAYNKARLEFELSQQPSLVAKLPVSLHDFLQQALRSHKHALSLNEENTDILFNTSQILVALAELNEGESDRDAFDPLLPASWLREALELLDACFTRQEMILEEQNKAWDEMASTEQDDGVSLASESMSAGDATTEQAVTVVNAITAEDLLDTALASIAALTQLVPLDMEAAQSIASLAESLVNSKIPSCISQLPADKQHASREEAALARASFAAALGDAEFTSGRIDGFTYLQRLTIFESLPRTSTEVVCDHADALIEFVASSFTSLESDPSLLHQVLNKALEFYQQAAGQLSASPTGIRDADGALSLSLVPKVDTAQEQRLASVHEAIGDAHLMQMRIMRAVSETGSSLVGVADVRAEASTRPQSATEAYRNAARSYTRAGDDVSASKAEVRMLVASFLNQDKAALHGQLAKAGHKGRRVLRAMVDEQIVDPALRDVLSR